jgi:hypothetical protein
MAKGNQNKLLYFATGLDATPDDSHLNAVRILLAMRYFGMLVLLERINMTEVPYRSIGYWAYVGNTFESD